MNVVKSERGAIIVEAALSLSFFMFAIMTVYSMFHVALAQARINAALNATAKEISEYSYVYNLTGLNQKQEEISNKNGAASNVLHDNLSEVKDLFGAFEGVVGTFSGITNSSEDKESFLYFIFNEGIDAAKGKLTGEASRVLMKKHFGSDPDKYLKRLGVVDGINGLSFSKSRLFVDGTEKEIILVVQYKVSVIKLLNIDMTMNFELCAKTRAWVGA